MTKQYTLVYLSDESYMIDKEATISRGDRFVVDKYNMQQYGIKTAEVIGNDVIRQAENFAQVLPFNKKECIKILASTDKSLNLPLIPDIEENGLVAYPVKTEWSDGSSRAPYSYDDNKEKRELWLEGYKANTKKWSDEDMRKAIILAWDRGSDPARQRRLAKVDEILDILQPRPIAVEVEMELVDYDYPNKCNFVEVYAPKLDENNFVIVKRWIY